MPLARSLSVTSLSGLEEWDEEFDLEDAVLFEIAWEVANKGEFVKTFLNTYPTFCYVPSYQTVIYTDYFYVIIVSSQ